MDNLSGIKMHTPGPGNIPWFIRLASVAQVAHHRDAFFKKIYFELQRNLQCIFKTKDPVLVMTCSGTGVMESVVKNIVNTNDSVLIIDTGKYSHRWVDILNVSNVKKVSVIRSNIEGGLVPYVNIETALSNIFPRFVFVSHCETSTGITYDLERLSRLCKKNGAKMIVDAMATVGVQPLYKDEWDIDVVISASHKGFMNAPGLGLVSIKEEYLNSNSLESDTLYFDYKSHFKYRYLGTTPNSPATSLVLGVHAATKYICKEGVENVWQRHKKCAEMCRAGVLALGLKIFSCDSYGNGVTAVVTPEGIISSEIINYMKNEFGILIANGQDELRDKIFRLGHIGAVLPTDIIHLITALEMTLCRLKGETYKAKGTIAVWNTFSK